MDPTDVDGGLPGTESSGSSGGLDVQRLIPINLIFQQVSKGRSVSQTLRTMNGMRPGEEFEDNEEGQYDCKGSKLLRKKQKKKKLSNTWEYFKVYFCDICDLLVKSMSE